MVATVGFAMFMVKLGRAIDAEMHRRVWEEQTNPPAVDTDPRPGPTFRY
jgi:hypothetical protein